MRAGPVFLSIGECMVELAPSGPGQFTQSFAGDTFNTAWYVRRCLPENWRVSYFTVLGDDPLSAQMLEFMQGAGLDTSAIWRADGRRPGLYMIHLADGERSFSYWRDSSAARLLASDPARLAAAMQAAQVIYFSGITLAILDGAGRDALLDGLAAARKNGRQIVFDPNLRPALWSTPDEMRAQTTRAARHADIILPSHDDEAVHFADPDSAATLDRYLGAGAGLVVVKNGAGEILAGDGRATFGHQPPPVMRPVDTTAAGDAFNAGFLAAFLGGRDVATALAAGAHVSAQVIMQPGALVSIDGAGAGPGG